MKFRDGLTPKMKPVSPRRSAIVAALDVGTSKIVCLIARLKPQGPQDTLRRRSHGIEILGIGHTEARGMKAGAVINLAEAEQAVRHAVDLAERDASVQLESVVLSMSSGRPSSESYAVHVNVAGSGGQGEGEGQRETTLLPVGTLEDARLVLALVAPGVPANAWDGAVLGDGADPGWRGRTAAARWLDPLSWRRNGWLDVASAVLLRSGRFTRRAIAVPHARIQSLTLRQGWLETRLGLATVHVVPAPGPVSPVLAHLDVARAEDFLAEVSGRARSARRRSEPPRAPLAPDPPGLVDWSRHPQGTPEPERP